MCSEEVTRCSDKGDLTLDKKIGEGLLGHVTLKITLKIEKLVYVKSAEELF